jgi:hypothetical protein
LISASIRADLAVRDSELAPALVVQAVETFQAVQRKFFHVGSSSAYPATASACVSLAPSFADAGVAASPDSSTAFVPKYQQSRTGATPSSSFGLSGHRKISVGPARLLLAVASSRSLNSKEIDGTRVHGIQVRGSVS